MKKIRKWENSKILCLRNCSRKEIKKSLSDILCCGKIEEKQKKNWNIKNKE